jgi:tetratricopeptide (TPR) repeat protein
MMRTTTATTRTTTRVAALGARATGRGRGRGRGRDARARASGDAQRAGADGDARDDARRGGATTRKNRRGLLGAGFAAAGLTGLTRAANAAPTLPKELTEPDEIFREDFNVQFAGLTVDHKDLIYALVVGQTIGFVGSAVGGAEARKRAEEIERLNSTLLKVNKEVRKELRSSQGRKVAFSTMDSSDEASSETVLEIISLLKSGKSKLKAQASQEAKETFTKARQLIDANQSALKEPWKAVRKAERGLGAASARLGEYDEALSHMKTVLKLSTEHDDTSVATDACGIIADIYAEMDQIEVAADWYDKYFESLAIEDAKEAAEAGSSSAR